MADIILIEEGIWLRNQVMLGRCTEEQAADFLRISKTMVPVDDSDDPTYIDPSGNLFALRGIQFIPKDEL